MFFFQLQNIYRGRPHQIKISDNACRVQLGDTIDNACSVRCMYLARFTAIVSVLARHLSSIKRTSPTPIGQNFAQFEFRKVVSLSVFALDQKSDPVTVLERDQQI